MASPARRASQSTPDLRGLGEHLGSNVEAIATLAAMECDDYQRAAMRTARDKDAPDEFMR